MPKKKFEDTPYDPIAADLMREVVTGGKSSTPASAAISSVPSPAVVVALPRGPVPPSSGEPLASFPPASAPTSAEPTLTKRFLLTRSENEELDAFLLRLQKRAGVKVTLSMFARAALNVVMQAEEQLFAEVGAGAPRRFPSTHDSIAQGAFEEWWMRCLANALRPEMSRGRRSPLDVDVGIKCLSPSGGDNSSNELEILEHRVPIISASRLENGTSYGQRTRPVTAGHPVEEHSARVPTCVPGKRCASA